MKVILPGSYDPITKGHLEIIKKASEEYSEVFAVAFVNPAKSYKFSSDERLEMLKIATRGLGNVKVGYSEGLVVDSMKENGIDLIVKGYRTDIDLEYERRMAEWNENAAGFKTRLIKCEADMEGVSSTLAREAIASGNSELLSEILPDGVAEYISRM